ncbi:hypothetical protein DDD_0232 [Nonlabens dokdonensis DSW-6]|uniref:Uncharacterized protein n=1 Tax=Nonlabens dokdonensis (strain DSM 17205 / KCTC 12402 / DSW-6) TaxID=592029 RepID=L7W5K2_NONDD|nr:hypothetical protein DDD_0232 [Nonlabens dokdonensis DSW-6]
MNLSGLMKGNTAKLKTKIIKNLFLISIVLFYKDITFTVHIL